MEVYRMISVSQILSTARRRLERATKPGELCPDGSFYRIILDTIPSPVFVTGENMRILDCNARARKLLSKEQTLMIDFRAGEVLHCLSAVEGCGKNPVCNECVIHEGVIAALRGKTEERRKAKMRLLIDGEIKEAFFLVTTAPLRHNGRDLVLVILEDISELTRLRTLLPICASCKKIRTYEDYWQSTDSYFNSTLGINFSHGFCPECLRKLYPQYADKIPRAAGEGHFAG
jgi:PAS domain-containing protein